MSDIDDELLKYFWPHPYPSSHPPLEVMFSNGLPTSNNDTVHKVLSVPYGTFEQAIKDLIRDAKIDELMRLETPFIDEPTGHRTVDSNFAGGERIMIHKYQSVIGSRIAALKEQANE